MGKQKLNSVTAKMVSYYSAKWAKHGAIPQGVDWNGTESQLLHFEQLVKIFDRTHGFSINDLGCGYGALFDYLCSRYRDFSYAGYDINDEMIQAARIRYVNSPDARFAVASEPLEIADFGVASGIFTLRLDRSDAECREYIEVALNTLDCTSRHGFAFNCLTSFSDVDKMKDYLYYPNPCDLFDLCKRRYSRHVALLHDYGLYAFTILVRKHL
jgi:SAM-dependent methyltransferase